MSYNKQSQQTKPVKASQLLSNLSQMSEMMKEILDRQKGFNSTGTQEQYSSSTSISSSMSSSSFSSSSEDHSSSVPILTITQLRTLVPSALYDTLCVSNDLTPVRYYCLSVNFSISIFCIIYFRSSLAN
jgi:hypothetical protein